VAISGGRDELRPFTPSPEATTARRDQSEA
jgi:hypothetical protein